MKILLCYPENPVTYWGFQHALEFISKKSAFPPLGLLTVAALLPKYYEMKLVDMNTEPLSDDDIRWADYVFISAMVIQKESVREVAARCRTLGVKTVGGGPLFTSEPEAYPEIDHLVLGEGETTLPDLIRDMEQGSPAHIYSSKERADLRLSPVPMWSLVDTSRYASLNIQYSRGCPFNCEFCNITALYGNHPRTKDSAQLLLELEAIYETGWRDGIFFVDDNFIGNRKKLTEEVLPALDDWMERRGRPFTFFTEASINLADDEALMEQMVKAGFNTVFVGIETPNEESLAECKKAQNKNRDLLSCVKKIQRSGLEVQGGFIVGFDHDGPSIFERMLKFIQESGIVTAMVGLLNAPKGTLLYERLSGEGRITEDFTGDNTDFTINFIPKMDRDTLIQGYRKLVASLYSPRQYYERIKNFMKNFPAAGVSAGRLSACKIGAFIRSVFRLGIFGRDRLYYWKLFFWSLFRRPRLFPIAIRFAIYGFHFRKMYENAFTGLSAGSRQ